MFTVSGFYKTKEWEEFLHVIKDERTNEEGLLICSHCGKAILKAYDCIGHHVTELTDENVNDFAVSLNPENVALVHHKCHNQIHERFGFEYTGRKIYIVYGSPCSGKTSWVKKNAGVNDLIVDIDSIYEAIGSSPRYIKSSRLTMNVFKARDCLIDMIKVRYGKWKTAYVIGGYPLSGERERLAEKLGAELIFIDTPKADCLERAKSGRPAEYENYINDWWEKYIPPGS